MDRARRGDWANCVRAVFFLILGVAVLGTFLSCRPFSSRPSPGSGDGTGAIVVDGGKEPNGDNGDPVKLGTGEVTGDKVNVRAGPNLNYEILTKVEAGQKLRVVSSESGWHEVLLPAGTSVWISSEYVKLPKTAPFPCTGEVTGNRVSVRAGGDLRRTVLCPLNRGDKVKVLDGKADWYRIEAPAKCIGWISGEFFKLEE